MRESDWKPSFAKKKNATSLTSPKCYYHDLTFGFVFPGVLYQFFELADRVVATDACTTVTNISNNFHLRVSRKQHIYERKSHETKIAAFILRGVRQTRS